ncbi:MAG TPA: amidase [Anaerolineales bacterium]|nr:amidase [Anaerolineales bacterium]
MIGRGLIEDLRTGHLLLPDFLAQVEAGVLQHDPSIQALLPEEGRFDRLYDEAEALILSYPDLVKRPLMFGAPLGVKDIFYVEGVPTKAGSRLPAETFQGREANSVSRLRDAGALFFGKTVTTEFAYFSPGPTRNPHNLEHTPGGSSSGSAAAVAAGFCHIALGTQTIGSIIRPASFCGVVGLKPTYDRISREGVIPLSPSLDHVGFFVPDVESALNAARVLYTDWDEPVEPAKVPRLGVPSGVYLESVSAESQAHFERLYKRFEEAGYEVGQIEIMPDFAEVRARHDAILSAEAAQVHAQWFGSHEELYSQKFTELIRRGQKISESQLQDALTAREGFRADLRRTFLDNNIDLWVCPSTIGPAPKGLESTGDPIMNLPWTQAGLPALNLPAGTSQEGLPLGLQLVANWYKDESLLFWARDLERALKTV